METSAETSRRRAHRERLARWRLSRPRPAPQDDPLGGELVFDGERRAPNSRIVAPEEADERNDEQRRIELVGAVVLLERAPLGDAVLEHLGGDCGRGCAPGTRLVGSSPQVHERRAAVGRDPARTTFDVV